MKAIAAAVVLASAAVAAQPAHAHGDAGAFIAGAITAVAIGAALSQPQVVYSAPAAPVYAPPVAAPNYGYGYGTPAPVYSAPVSVYSAPVYTPPAVVYRPPVVVYPQPRPVYVEPGWGHRHHYHEARWYRG